ncbi:MAG: acyl-CoA dehydrogenase family protein [Planctomycetes bacterium]|nr:acyl-CoA dehydrogenase family protein [Planctomycetota bacterium]
MDHMLDLPFFNDEQRSYARELDVNVGNHLWPDPEVIDDGQALLTALKTLGKADVLKHAVSDPWSLRANVLIREVLAYHAGIADLAYIMQALGGVPITIAGTDDQKQSILPGAASGELCLAFAITEPGAGSDLTRLSMPAEKDGEGYVLNGVKHLVSNVGVATHYTLFARTGDGNRGLTAFILPADSEGLSFEKQTPTAPHPLGRMVFEDVKLPASARLGEEGGGMKIALATLGRMRTTVAAAANGMARRALDEALLHCKSRELFGSTLAEQPIAQGMLAEMRARLDASRLLTYRAAWLFDKGSEKIPLEAGVAKWQSTENAQWIIDKALQLAGGKGTLRGSIFERLYREIRPLRIYEGASEIQQLVVARAMLE